ncbi:MAG: mechanosensitive ion channel family protein, partial [Planctomycetota bacterium]
MPKLLTLFILIICSLATVGVATAQDAAPPEGAEADLEAPEKVDVEPVAEDQEIAQRLQRILEAVESFHDARVEVDEGVVFLSGEADTDDRKAWAGNLARNTQDVVAVVNNLRVRTPDLFDFGPAYEQLNAMMRSAIQSVPTTGVALTLLLLSIFAASGTKRLVAALAPGRIRNPLLRGVIAKAAAIPVLLLGAYLALRVSGLTRLAATVLGGTGLLGIVIGIAFRDIAENFLASILISVQRPFRAGDLVTIDGKQGFVQAVTTRGTHLMTLDGNHLQIPNSMVYKSIIENASANPNVRLSFVVGIDYGDAAEEAQQTVLNALRSHAAVLNDPEPLVLVDELASSTVNLRVFFWADGEKYGVLKVRSAVLRRVKVELTAAGFTLPDEAR